MAAKEDHYVSLRTRERRPRYHLTQGRGKEGGGKEREKERD
jgi:hypothetical protein